MQLFNEAWRSAVPWRERDISPRLTHRAVDSIRFEFHRIEIEEFSLSILMRDLRRLAAPIVWLQNGTVSSRFLLYRSAADAAPGATNVAARALLLPARHRII
jgi:hypothetical protein